MKKCLAVCSSMLVSAALAAGPVVKPNSISISRDEMNAVKIAYTLTNEPAIVTMTLETNTLAGAAGEWVPIPGADVGLLSGAANRYVGTLDKEVSAYWFPNSKFAGLSMDCLRATVTAWATNTPPDYMVVGLEDKGDIRFYTSTNALPGGLANPAYRRSKLVMRKIPAKGVVWLMGSPNSLVDPNNPTNNEFAHKIRLTDDYYVGVFELTQGQLEAIGSPNYSYFAGEANHEDLPAERLGWTSIYTAINALRGRSGLISMDLPTEAQWEYACHAGCGGKLYGGLEWTETNLAKIAWYKGNASSKTRPVGLKMPNGFGLYDMLGNVWEFTRDTMGITQGSNVYLESYQDTLAEGWENGAVTENPQGAVNVSNRKMKRGGSWYEGVYDSGAGYAHRTNCRTDGSKSWCEGSSGTIGYIGCRVSCLADDAVMGVGHNPHLQ